MDTTDTARQIDQITSAIEAHGYWVSAEPIPGQEELFLSHLREGWDKIQTTMDFVSRKHNTRDRSKRALGLLHSYLPSPIWAVELPPQ